MGASMTKFIIALDSPDSEFSPGEIVSGKVVLELDKVENARGIRVRFRGMARVRWTSGIGTGIDSTTHSNMEEYFKMEFYVVGGSSGDDNIEIQPGLHVYPFNFSLPRNIPSSFETINGYVRYTIKATIDRPWKFDQTTKVSFTVVTPLDLSEFPAMRAPIEDEDVETFCCFPCVTMGTMRVRFYMPTSGFAVGEALKAKIELDNNSTSVDVQMIRLKLEQVITLDGRSRKLKMNNNVQEAKKKGPFAKKTEIMMNVQVPEVPSSNLSFCNIIDICYRLVVKIYVSGCHCTIKKSYPIFIGTRPVLNCQPIVTSVPPKIVQNPSSFGSPMNPSMDNDTSTPKNTIPSSIPMIDLNSDDPIPLGTNPNEEIYPSPIPRILNPGCQYSPAIGGSPIGFVDPQSVGLTSGSTEKPLLSYDDCMKMTKNG